MCLWQVNVSKTHRCSHTELLGGRLLDLGCDTFPEKKVYAPEWALDAHEQRVVSAGTAAVVGCADPYRDSLSLRDHTVRRRLVGGGGCIGSKRRWVDGRFRAAAQPAQGERTPRAASLRNREAVRPSDPAPQERQCGRAHVLSPKRKAPRARASVPARAP